MDNETLWYGLGAVATFITALVGAVVTLKKYGPEVNRIQIESANDLVSMARTAADMSAETARDLRERNIALDNRVTELARQLGEQAARITELEEKAEEVDMLRVEVERERAEKERLAQENVRLTIRVSDLEREVEDLRANGPANA